MFCIDKAKLPVCGLLFSVCLLNATTSWSASKPDRQQPMTVEADTAELNERTGVSIYSGNVVVTQGSMIMKAERVNLQSKDNKLTSMKGTGKPATYRQKDANTGAPIIGKADQIIYMPGKSQLILVGKASLFKDDNTVKSERIVYNIESDYVSAGTKSGGKRVKIVIQPTEDSQDGTP